MGKEKYYQYFVEGEDEKKLVDASEVGANKEMRSMIA